MGLKPSPEIAAISMVYFVQGILGLARLALSFFLKDDLKLEPAQVAFLTGLAGLPWMIKPLYGFISDTFPLFGYKRKSYMVICGLLGTVAWAGLATNVTTPSGAAVMMLLGSLSTACSDVVVDSIVVERARGEPQVSAAAAAWCQITGLQCLKQVLEPHTQCRPPLLLLVAQCRNHAFVLHDWQQPCTVLSPRPPKRQHPAPQLTHSPPHRSPQQARCSPCAGARQP